MTLRVVEHRDEASTEVFLEGEDAEAGHSCEAGIGQSVCRDLPGIGPEELRCTGDPAGDEEVQGDVVTFDAPSPGFGV